MSITKVTDREQDLMCLVSDLNDQIDNLAHQLAQAEGERDHYKGLIDWVTDQNMSRLRGGR